MNLSLFVLLILTVWCQCPNDCNGHGKCTIDLTCDCYKKGLSSAENSTAGFTGADCSEALCPLGFPFQTYTGSLSTPVTSAPAGGGETPVVIRSMKEEEKEIAKSSVRRIADGDGGVDGGVDGGDGGNGGGDGGVDGGGDADKGDGGNGGGDGGNPPVDPPVDDPIFTYEFLIDEKPVFKVEKSKYSCGASTIISCDLILSDTKTATILSYNDKEMHVKYDGYTSTDVEDPNLADTITAIKALTVLSVSTTKKDMTNYKGITIPAVVTEKLTWENYVPILTTMGFDTTESNTVQVLCYHPTENVNGFLYNHTATISKSTESDKANDIVIEIKEGSVKDSLAADDVCFLMAKSNGDTLFLDSKASNCDVCNQFQLKNNQLLVKAKVHEDVSIASIASTYTMIIDSTLTRFIINHYNEKKEIELPPKTEDASSKEFYDKLRKQAKLSVSMIKFDGTAEVEDSLFPKVENAIILSYNDETNIITIDKNLNFNQIKARMLDDSDKRYKLKLILTPCEDLTPITPNNDLKIYKVPKAYSFKGKSSEITCGDNNEITGRVWASDTTTTPDSPIAYISYNISNICSDAYKCGDNKIYPLDLECKEVESTIRKDMTNYIDIEIDASNEITLSGFRDIFTTLGMTTLPSTAKVLCYNSNKDFGVLTEYDKSSLASDGSSGVKITIEGDSSSKLNTGDICYLMIKFDGSNIDLTKDSCDICSSFYLDPGDSKYYIKDIYLNRIEEDSGGDVTIGYYKIQSIIDQYYSTSIYPLLSPSENFYKDKIVLNDILEVSLKLKKADSNPVTDTSSIVNITETNVKAGEKVNLTLSNPMIKLKSKFDANKNNLDLILTNKIIKNYECDTNNKEKIICHHRLLKLDLGIQGGSVIITKKCSDGESKINGDVLSYKSAYPQECYIKYSEEIDDDCEYSNYVVTSKRNDLSLYNNAVVEDDGGSSTIKWTGYGNAVKLMGMNTNEKIFMCKKDDNSNTLEEKKTSSVTINGDVVFTFDGSDSSPTTGSICYLVYKQGEDGFDFGESEASKLYKYDKKEWISNTPAEDAVEVTIPTPSTNEKNEIQPVLNIDVGSTLSNTIIEKSKDDQTSSSVLPIPIPKTDPETVTNIINQINRINVNVQVYKNLKLVFQGTALVSEFVKNDDENDLIIVKTTPVLDIYSASQRLRQLQHSTDEYRVIYSFSTPLNTVNSLRMLGLDLKLEGGSLYCHNNMQGWDGVVDVIYYNNDPKENEDNMYFISKNNVVENDTLTCEVRFKRNDLSLYAKSVVEKVEDENKIIKWEGYAEAFKKIVESNSISTNIPFICYNPSTKESEGKVLIEYTGKVTDLENNNTVKITIDADVGNICFPASQSSKLESRLLINHLDVGDSCSKVDGKWYYGTVDGKPIDIKDKDGNPSVNFDPIKTNTILQEYEKSGELHLAVDTTEEVSSLFSRNINPGMTLEVYSGITFIDSGIIVSVRRESGNEIIIKTVNKLELPIHNNVFNPKHRLLADTYSGEPIRFVVRPSQAILGPIECSGAGKCDRSTGLCQCYEGYTGKICDRIECPNNCNGNGRCVPLSELLSNNDLANYEGYGNTNRVFGCLCDKRHRGYDCSLIECPSGTDPLDPSGLYAEVKKDCSGRGICNYNTGTCECFDGFSGEGCQYMIAAL